MLSNYWLYFRGWKMFRVEGVNYRTIKSLELEELN
jgi:hypothetical protein